MFMGQVLCACLAAFVLFLAPSDAHAKQVKDRVKRDFRHADENGDGELSRAEWKRRGNFERLDRNGNGALSLDEVRAIYKDHDQRNYDWPPKDMAAIAEDIDPTIAQDRMNRDALDKETMCGIGRALKCDIEPQKNRGLIETGTGPRFPDNANCPGIDDYWAMDYASKRERQSFHGGIDLPVPWGTPVRAVADGSVVTLYTADNSKRGAEVVVRHSPAQTDLPMWTYSAYGHLDVLPDLKVGQKLKMGQIIGPTGNTGITAMGSKGDSQSSTRRPAIHLAMFYSATNTYSEVNDTIVPVDGYWLDPMAFYRQKEPFESHAVKALPESEKDVDIPILFDDGMTWPPDTKVIWPYTCKRN
ncbi:peptidoglycan DD-metalloendopeptidase family protein [Magnetovibrio sp.]|uniref:peptidoglycan DD-metalloendopeptidase family protein n=1 Tax=Magnetovibrio sp. TaxID=2024836 RepID=UPI002F948EA1